MAIPVDLARPRVVTEFAPFAGAYDALSSIGALFWIELPNRMLSWAVKRGKQHDLGVTDAASGKFVYDNSDRSLDPTNTASAFYDGLRPMRRIRRRLEWGSTFAVVSATNATPIVVSTGAAHGWPNGATVTISGVVGNTAANGLHKITSVTATTFALTNVYSGANVAGNGAYISGGTIRRFWWDFHGYCVDFPASWTGPGSSTTTVELVDAFALFQTIPIPASPWELVVQRDHPSFWFKPGSGDVAFDVSGSNRHGTYQGKPAFEPPIIPAYDGAGFAPNRVDTPGARASFPHKDLISGFPFTVECVFKTVENRSAHKVIFYAIEGAGSGEAIVSLTIEPDSHVPSGNGGKLRARVRTSPATTTTIYGTIPVDDGILHHVVWVATSKTNMKLYLDGIDITYVYTTASDFPGNLTAGYSVGNTPAVTFGDFSFATEDGDVLGDVVVYNGVSLDLARIIFHWLAATTGWVGMKTGVRIDYLLSELGWSSQDIDTDLGATTMPAGLVNGSLLANFQAGEKAEAGSTYMGRDGKVTHRDRYKPITAPGNVSQFTFGEGFGEVLYDPPANFGSMEADLYSRAEGNRVGGPKQVVVNTATEATYGIRAIPGLSDLRVETDALVNDYLHWVLDQYDEPITRVQSVTVKPQEDATVVWPEILDADLGTMTTFKAQPPALPSAPGPLFTQASHIEQIESTWTPYDVSYVYGLSPAATTTTFAAFGTALFGTAEFAF